MPLEIGKLSKRYGNKWVLRDVSLDAAEGRILGICGATASGKSTLLNAIAGLTKTSGGSVMLNSTDLSTTKAKDRRITLMKNHEASGFLGKFGVGTSSDSSGERQFAAFENAVSNAGKVLLLDDPFDQMDRHIRQQCFDKLILAARERGLIVIFAARDFDQIAAVADNAAVLSGGDIVQYGTPQRIYDIPETVDAAKLSGDNNLFEARRLSSSDADLPEFQTIVGNHRIFAHRADKSRLAAINKNVTLAIRPEQIVMSMGASFPEDNLLRAVVTTVKFRGATSLIEFDAAGLKLETRVFKVVGLNIGDECMLSLPPHRILIFKD